MLRADFSSASGKHRSLPLLMALCLFFIISLLSRRPFFLIYFAFLNPSSSSKIQTRFFPSKTHINLMGYEGLVLLRFPVEISAYFLGDDDVNLDSLHNFISSRREKNCLEMFFKYPIHICQLSSEKI